MAAILRGSSHTNTVTREMLSTHAPKLASAVGYKGLQVLSPRIEKKEKQFLEFEKEIVEASETSNTIVLQTVSNDFEKILLKKYGNERGKSLLKLRKFAMEKWATLTHDQRANYYYRRNCFLVDSSEKFLKNKLKEYGKVLSDLVAKTKLKVVYQCSVLERKYLMYDEVHLEMLFAALNSYLEITIKNLKAKNVLGEKVIFKYIRLTHQYHSEIPFWGFRPSEVNTWRSEKEYHRRFGRYRKYRYPVSLTHRSVGSTRELLEHINGCME